ncbi:flavodoxin domain-containing protein [Halobacillus kuroshimensis]|uniref:flavodoxin domain-containing protein n=1 Tax=Halobacillus kuroshimensis TaxID=302481 RepID=UPI00041DFC42|nr:flavodoxin domain-containing protein [Halobacillus kuroshimensis]
MKSIIVYTSKHGSTEKAVQLLSDRLDGEVAAVKVDKAWGINLHSYDRVILGGPIYNGQLSMELSSYAVCHLHTLMETQIGLFILAAAEDVFTLQRELEEAFPAPLYAYASAKESFGYELHLGGLSALEKVILEANGISRNASKLSFSDIERFADMLNKKMKIYR